MPNLPSESRAAALARNLTAHTEPTTGRRYFAYAPPHPAPLLLAFHGLAQEVDGKQGPIWPTTIERDFVLMSGLAERAERHGFGVAFLEADKTLGFPLSLMGWREWRFNAGAGGGWPTPIDNYDVAYAASVVQDWNNIGMPWDGRIVVAGFSDGAAFAHLAIHALLPQVVGAVFHSGRLPPNGMGALAHARGRITPRVRERAERELSTRLRSLAFKFPVAVVCEIGGLTPLCSLAFSLRTAKLYRAAGYDVDDKFVPGGHQWWAEGNVWILRHVGLISKEEAANGQ